MREILFRGKCIELCKHQGQWLEGFYGEDDGRSLISHSTDIGLIGYACDSDTIGQYTGSKDRNGKKIFEHDIVRIAVCGTYDNYVVSYDKENARFVVGDIDFTMVRIFSPKIEVIGNIHDNPELLEAIKEEKKDD